MEEYEITYLSNPSLADDARAEVDGTVDTTIEKHQGTITHNTTATRRRLAYPIAKQTTGFARTVQTTLDPANLVPLRDSINKLDGIIRLSIIRTPQREEVSPAIFEAATKEKEQQVQPKKVAPAKKMSDEEVEEKIAAALEEEVK